MTPNTLAEKFDTSRQAVSKHINILQKCGLVKAEQSGREIYYFLNAHKMKDVDAFPGTFRKLWAYRFNQLDDLLSNL